MLPAKRASLKMRWCDNGMFERSHCTYPHRIRCADLTKRDLRWAGLSRETQSEQLFKLKQLTPVPGKRINRGGQTTDNPRDHRQLLVSTHVWIHKLRRRWGRCHRYLHRSATHKGQGCRNRQRGRSSYPSGKVSIQYVISLGTYWL